MYYDSAQIQGAFTLIPPPPSTNCNTTAPFPAWEIRDFGITFPCSNCTPSPWTLPAAGYQIAFGLRNLANDYDVGCSYFRNILNTPSVPEWNFCGVDPEDAPLLPATWFQLDWESHVLKVDQTWVCEGKKIAREFFSVELIILSTNADATARISYHGHGSVYVPWVCEPLPGLPTGDGGFCQAEMPPRVTATGVLEPAPA